MAERAAISPAALPADTSAPVRRLPSATRLSLRIKDSAPKGLRIARLSLDLPINRSSTTGERFAARLGPDEYLIIGPVQAVDGLNSDIAAALSGRFHAIVDVSHASVAFGVEGPAAANILNAGCPLDLDIRRFPAGSATRTVLGKCEIILFCVSPSLFRVECWRSFGEYVHAFLLEAAALNGAAPTLTGELHS